MHVTTNAAPAPDSNVTSAEHGDDNFSADRRSVYTLAATFLACSALCAAGCLLTGLMDTADQSP